MLSYCLSRPDSASKYGGYCIFALGSLERKWLRWLIREDAHGTRYKSSPLPCRIPNWQHSHKTVSSFSSLETSCHPFYTKATILFIMKITAILATVSFLSFSGVCADPHTQCNCGWWSQNQRNYDWQLTYNTCHNNFAPDVVSDHLAAPTYLEDWWISAGQVWPRSWSSKDPDIILVDKDIGTNVRRSA
jgi:hypothetical protein